MERRLVLAQCRCVIPRLRPAQGADLEAMQLSGAPASRRRATARAPVPHRIANDGERVIATRVVTPSGSEGPGGWAALGRGYRPATNLFAWCLSRDDGRPTNTVRIE